MDGVLYVIGGEFEPSGVARQGVFQDTVWAYDPRRASATTSEAWMPRAAMPTARSGMAGGVVEGKVYVAGGRPPRGHDFAVYDPAADAWTALPDLPTQRNHLAVEAIAGRVYVAGGRFGGGVGSEMTAAFEVYDPATNAWTALPPLPAPRAGSTAPSPEGACTSSAGRGTTPTRRASSGTWTSTTPWPGPGAPWPRSR